MVGSLLFEIGKTATNAAVSAGAGLAGGFLGIGIWRMFDWARSKKKDASD